MKRERTPALSPAVLSKANLSQGVRQPLGSTPFPCATQRWVVHK